VNDFFRDHPVINTSLNTTFRRLLRSNRQLRKEDLRLILDLTNYDYFKYARLLKLDHKFVAEFLRTVYILPISREEKAKLLTELSKQYLKGKPKSLKVLYLEFLKLSNPTSFREEELNKLTIRSLKDRVNAELAARVSR